jgi:hypothetical protein
VIIVGIQITDIDNSTTNEADERTFEFLNLWKQYFLPILKQVPKNW